MAPIDYSKWERLHVDSGSEEEEDERPKGRTSAHKSPAQQAPAAQPKAQPAAKPVSNPPSHPAASQSAGPSTSAPRAPPASQPAAQPIPRPVPEPSTSAPTPSPPAEIPCTYAPSRGDTAHRFLAPFSAPPNHPVFTAGVLSPLSALVGMPLRVWRNDARPSLSIPRSADDDNQIITYIMIDPFSGFAPPAWQQGIGSVICGRADRKPLPPAHVEALWMFADHLLSLFSEGDEVHPDKEMTPAAFRKHYTEDRLNQVNHGSRRQQGKWALVPAPWEM